MFQGRKESRSEGGASEEDVEVRSETNMGFIKVEKAGNVGVDGCLGSGNTPRRERVLFMFVLNSC